MKNLFKFGFVALAISLSVAACNSDKSAEGADSTAVDTATVVDTTMAAPMDSMATDSAATDSVK
ncbi:MAG: hypothetical protein H7Y07_06605 [Pyrinomonadaceae bacterium]|nr:hypothetical protein [Sphingobacteriaceae bacterium]